MSEWFFPKALVEGRVAHNVRVSSDAGVITEVTVDAQHDRHSFSGVAVPGFANTHSHVFHRGLRGAGEGEDFWSWRTEMYRLANRLDPDSYHRLARAAFAEMVAAGYTSVGEFHYVHHQPDGTAYPGHAMEMALAHAAMDAGIRLTLLDTCYLHAGPGKPLGADQVRFGDSSVEGWLERWHALGKALPDSVTLGAALHSVRAVSPDEMSTAVAGLPDRTPIHVHVSEQPRENEECLAAHGLTPTAVLERSGVLSDRTTVVHATHLSDEDIAMLAASNTIVSLCPTTEADLGDGIARIKDLHEAGVRLTIGTDEDVVTDPFAELRMMESTARLATGTRGVVGSNALWKIGSQHGVESLRPATEPRPRRFSTPTPDYDPPGFGVGDPADVVVINPSSPRLAGVDPMRWPLAAAAEDVTGAIIAGKWVRRDDATAESLRHVLNELRGRDS